MRSRRYESEPRAAIIVRRTASRSASNRSRSTSPCARSGSSSSAGSSCRCSSSTSRSRAGPVLALHHLLEIEEKGDSPLTALIVLGQVMLGLLVIVAVETTVAMAFYLGWL